MIIVIPLGGTGKRFKDSGFKLPKALIKVSNKEILYHLLDNLKISANIRFIYIPYNEEYVEYDLESKLLERYPSYRFRFFALRGNTRGAAETIYLALKQLLSDNMRYPTSVSRAKDALDGPVLCLDSDGFYTFDIIKEWDGRNSIFTFISKTNEAKFSYVELNENDVTDIVEKTKISDNACTGAYGFGSYYALMDYCRHIIDNDVRQKEEFYTSGVIKEMIKGGISFTNINVRDEAFFSLGTPEQTRSFESRVIHC